ncbi:MAG TPA: response regulator [Verrucomicrobiae bacterium]|nr:response regulator [Verrucomicrobiae bacterium]
MHNVLVIDDVDDVRQAVVKTLQHFGFVTREARNGRSGIQMAIEDAPDLIICDVRMPGMDGYRTLTAIRDIPAIANIPFIFLTAAMDKSDIRRGMLSGADDYLTKPFTPEELFEAVATRLARQTELKCEFFKHAEKMRKGVEHLFAREITGPLDGILGLTAEMLRDAGRAQPEKVAESARRINESILRLNQLAKSLA